MRNAIIIGIVLLGFCCVFLHALHEDDVGYIFHISDLHFDQKYTIGSATKCILGNSGLGCCRSDSIPLPDSTPAGKWGSYGCDTPMSLLNATLQWASENLLIDVIVWTGDSVDHHDLTQSWDGNRAEIKAVTGLLEYYFPKVPVFSCLGNHDSWPVDQLYPGVTAPIYLPELAQDWNKFFTPESAATFAKGGYYTQPFPAVPGLRVVVLNSLLLDNMNLAVKKDPEADLMHQWEWFNQTLFLAKHSHEKIWIMGHIPPGSSEAVDWFSAKYQTLLADYSGVVLAQFWGHSHHDAFRLIRDPSSSVTGIILISGSIVPDQHYPSIRLLTFNRTQGNLLDYHQYWLNWTEQVNSPSFIGYTLAYSARDAYGLSNLSAGEFALLAQRLRQDPALLLDRYYWYNVANTTASPCDHGCQQGLLCDLEWIVESDHDACMK